MHLLGERRELLSNQISAQNTPGNDKQLQLIVQTRLSWPYFTDEKTEAQRGFEICSGLQIEQVTEPGLELRSV